MAVKVTKNHALEISQDDQSFLPSAEEIFSVLYENKQTIRNVNVSKNELLNTGLSFSSEAADPVIIVEKASQPGDRVFIRLVGKLRSIEANVVAESGTLLDYCVIENKWIPFLPGTFAVVEKVLSDVGISQLGEISLLQYMKTVREVTRYPFFEDRTQSSLSASSISQTISGEIPEGIKGHLYRYQINGYHWLSYICNHGLGCIIADEMGLGKTVQVICLITEHVQKKKTPNLVIAPATLLENWRREILKFSDNLKVLLHYGNTRTGRSQKICENDVVICSYETAVADISLLNDIKWNLLILDEAHAIRNASAKRTKQIKTIVRKNAIAVTGTPLENRLNDLWSLVDFVFPTYLGTLSQFEKQYLNTIESAASLEPSISPIILRRSVNDVAGDLPPKIVIPQPLEMDPESACQYEEIRAFSETENRKGASITSLIKLRMFCVHPWLTNSMLDFSDPLKCSVKLNRLYELLDEIYESEGKVLIFTSFQKSVDLLAGEIPNKARFKTEYIDGRVSVPERQIKVDKFSNEKGPSVLVINPYAGGTGLNITAANHVIHFNLEWNPTIEDQASARAYRRGQTKPVTVHRFFYTNTVEEVINERMERKREIANSALLGNDGSDTDVEDIIRALRISPIKE